MKVFFFDVDTQNDFMNSDGDLYVPDAESLKPILEKLTLFALENDIPIHGSVDCHTKEDAEFIPNGGPFPYHCLRNSRGQLKIRETKVVDKESYILNSIGKGLLPEEWGFLTGPMGTGSHLIFEKQTYDVMTNRTLIQYKKHIEETGMDLSDINAVVYGVATDYCVKAAALGLKSLGLQVFVVKDAIKEITPEGRDEAFAEFGDAGIKLISSSWLFSTIAKKP